MVITNKLVCQFDFGAIGERYDIYQITTSDRYIAYGSYILDIPTKDLKAVSVTFDQGKSAYAMFDKGKVDRAQLVRLLNDEKLSIRPMPPQEMSDAAAPKVTLVNETLRTVPPAAICPAKLLLCSAMFRLSML